MSLALVKETEEEIIIQNEMPDWVFDVLQDDTKQKRFWITKGLGAGGTYGGVIWHIELCNINYLSPRSWVIAPTYAQIMDTMIPTFVEVLTTLYQMEEGTDFEVIRSANPRIELKNTGQQILFKSGNRPERFVGPSISHVLMSEPGLIKREAYEKSSARLRCPKAFRLQYMGEGTPEGLGNFYEKEANFPEGVHPKKNAERIILHTSDNKVLGPDYVNVLKETYSYDPHKLRSYLYGEFIGFVKGTAYWELSHARNIKLDLKPSPLLPITMMWDWNHTPLAWCAGQVLPVWTKQSTKFDRATILGESTGKYSGIIDSCAEFITQFDPEVYKNTPIEIDGGCDGYFKSHLTDSCAFEQVEACLKKYYNNVSVVASRSAPPIKDRLQKHNAILAYGFLVIAKWCRNTITSHEQTNLIDGQWKIKKDGKDMVTHWADAVGYWLFRTFKHIDLDKPNHKQIYGFN